MGLYTATQICGAGSRNSIINVVAVSNCRTQKKENVNMDLEKLKQMLDDGSETALDILDMVKGKHLCASRRIIAPAQKNKRKGIQ